jgi:hypothetical protein
MCDTANMFKSMEVDLVRGEEARGLGAKKGGRRCKSITIVAFLPALASVTLIWLSPAQATKRMPIPPTIAE